MKFEDHKAFCCPRRRVQCPNDCQIFSIEHKKLDAYLEECPMQMVCCSKCSMQFRRSEQELHEQQHLCERSLDDLSVGLHLIENPDHVIRNLL